MLFLIDLGLFLILLLLSLDDVAPVHALLLLFLVLIGGLDLESRFEGRDLVRRCLEKLFVRLHIVSDGLIKWGELCGLRVSDSMSDNLTEILEGWVEGQLGYQPLLLSFRLSKIPS